MDDKKPGIRERAAKAQEDARTRNRKIEQWGDSVTRLLTGRCPRCRTEVAAETAESSVEVTCTSCHTKVVL